MSLSALNSRGLIAGPDEEEESFFKRCQKSAASVSPPSSLAKKLFDIEPSWVEVSYSNKGLRFWEAGCAWIGEGKVALQLTSRKLFGLYSNEEVLAHEFVHAVRLAFDEPIFEEMLAYQTSPFWLRRYFGPFFRSSKEVLVFFIAILSFLGLFTISPGLSFFGFLTMLVGGVARLVRAHSIFEKTRSKLGKMFSVERALHIMVRLTDREIIRFSKMREEEIKLYADKMKRNHVRWNQIYASYFV